MAAFAWPCWYQHRALLQASKMLLRDAVPPLPAADHCARPPRRCGCAAVRVGGVGALLTVASVKFPAAAHMWRVRVRSHPAWPCWYQHRALLQASQMWPRGAVSPLPVAAYCAGHSRRCRCTAVRVGAIGALLTVASVKFPTAAHMWHVRVRCHPRVGALALRPLGVRFLSRGYMYPLVPRTGPLRKGVFPVMSAVGTCQRAPGPPSLSLPRA